MRALVQHFGLATTRDDGSSLLVSFGSLFAQRRLDHPHESILQLLRPVVGHSVQTYLLGLEKATSLLHTIVLVEITCIDACVQLVNQQWLNEALHDRVEMASERGVGDSLHAEANLKEITTTLHDEGLKRLHTCHMHL